MISTHELREWAMMAETVEGARVRLLLHGTGLLISGRCVGGEECERLIGWTVLEQAINRVDIIRHEIRHVVLLLASI